MLMYHIRKRTLELMNATNRMIGCPSKNKRKANLKKTQNSCHMYITIKKKKCIDRIRILFPVFSGNLLNLLIFIR